MFISKIGGRMTNSSGLRLMSPLNKIATKVKQEWHCLGIKPKSTNEYSVRTFFLPDKSIMQTIQFKADVPAGKLTLTECLSKGKRTRSARLISHINGSGVTITQSNNKRQTSFANCSRCEAIETEVYIRSLLA